LSRKIRNCPLTRTTAPCGKTYVVTAAAAGQANTRRALLMAGVPISQLPGED